MRRTLNALRALAVAAAVAAVAAVLAFSPAGAKQAIAQQSRFSAEITNIEIAETRVTLKASMGQQTLRVAPGVALDASHSVSIHRLSQGAPDRPVATVG